MRETDFYQMVFEANGTAMAILEEDATILLVNARFEKISGYARGELENKKKWADLFPEGSSYLAAGHDVSGGDEPAGAPFRCECRIVDKQGRSREGFLSVSPIPETRRSVASIADATEFRKVEELTRRRSPELTLKARELEELNATLKILLRRKEEDKNELEEKVLSNIQRMVMPYLDKLKKSRLDNRSMVHLSALESNLKDIVSPFVHKLSRRYLSLTPKELQVAYLIKEGKSTKEIAELMNVGSGAIDLHRNHLRYKLGLVKKKVNLRSYLLSLE